MIKAVMHAQGESGNGTKPVVLLLGFSHANLDKLREKAPIFIDAQEIEDMGLPGISVLIFADESEEKIMEILESKFAVLHQGSTRQ